MQNLLLITLFVVITYKIITYYHRKAIMQSEQRMRKQVEEGIISIESARLLRDAGYKI